MTHKCYGHCPEYTSEQCKHCLVADEDLAVGDVVVFADSNMPTELMVVSNVSTAHHGVMLNKDTRFCLAHLLRTATKAERKAGFRLPPPALLFVETLPEMKKVSGTITDPQVKVWDFTL
ncbi:hypothetical protein [Acinetobacter colistiniresistens]|uniref:hypothetical protein n=1 Tax=Acinetobacter colistiniresistens TaxID=280145 RepID=UPI0012501B9C|nr:hypothetical protein [Acinetobacter colistiniresistens]